MNRIWIIHRSITSNLGDILLGKGLENLLNEYGLQTVRLDYTGLGKNKLFNFFLLCLDKINLTFFACFLGIFLNVRYAIKEKPNFIFIGGGQLLLPINKFIYSLLGWFIFSKLIDAKLIIFSVGTEKRNNKFPAHYKKILRYILRNSDVVRLRDRDSQLLIKEITGMYFPIVIDTAYGLDLKKWKVDQKRDVYVCPIQKEEVLIYGVYKNMNNYFEKCFGVIKSTIENNEKIFIFSTHKNDLEAMKHFYHFLYHEKGLRNIFILSIQDEDNLLETLGKARVVIGGRMHALIISHILGANVYTIDHNNKLKYFCKEILPLSPDLLQKELKKSLKNVLYPK